MVKFETKWDKNFKIYIPKEIRKAFKTNRLVIMPNSFAAVMFPRGNQIERVIKSVEILLADLKHQLEAKSK
jgi:hypothetical protein